MDSSIRRYYIGILHLFPSFWFFDSVRFGVDCKGSFLFLSVCRLPTDACPGMNTLDSKLQEI